MKIRSGFVSNSSSSSFVIAIKQNATIAEIRESLKKSKKDFDEVAKWLGDAEDIENQIGVLSGDCGADVLEFVAQSLYYGYMIGLDVEGWHVSADNFGNDGDNTFSMIMYNLGSFNDDVLKIKSFN